MKTESRDVPSSVMIPVMYSIELRRESARLQHMAGEHEISAPEASRLLREASALVGQAAQEHLWKAERRSDELAGLR